MKITVLPIHSIVDHTLCMVSGSKISGGAKAARTTPAVQQESTPLTLKVNSATKKDKYAQQRLTDICMMVSSFCILRFSIPMHQTEPRPNAKPISGEMKTICRK